MRRINLLKRNILQYLELRSLPIALDDLNSESLQNQEIKNLFDLIKSKHKQYISTISSADMAMSLELANYLFRYCLINKPKTIVDLGSGFSSFVFRLYLKNSSDVIVYSVDDHKDWLHKTKEYLKSENLSTEYVMYIDEFFKLNNNGRFDLVLLDLNYVEVRKNYILSSASLLNDSGVCIIDDVHKVEFLRDVKRVGLDKGLKLRNIKRLTCDELGRFAIALSK